MVAALAPKPLARAYAVPIVPTIRIPLHALPPLPQMPIPTPGTNFGRLFGGIGLTISALWAGKSAYDAVKAVPSQLPWLPGHSVAPEIWSDPERVAVEAHARFGTVGTSRLEFFRFVREKQAIP